MATSDLPRKSAQSRRFSARLRWPLYIALAAVVLLWLVSGGILVMDVAGYIACPTSHQMTRQIVAEIGPEVVRSESPWGISHITGRPPYHITFESNIWYKRESLRIVIRSVKVTVIGDNGHEEAFDVTPPAAPLEMIAMPHPMPSNPNHAIWHFRERIADIPGLDFSEHAKCRVEIDALLTSDLMVKQGGEETIRVDTEFCRTSHWELLPYFVFKSRKYLE